MNIRARLALVDVIALWAEEFALSPEEEIELLQKQLNISKEAALVAAMDGWSPEEE